jgi:hypothetical protein
MANKKQAVWLQILKTAAFLLHSVLSPRFQRVCFAVTCIFHVRYTPGGAWKGIRRIFDNPSPRQPLMPFFHGKMFTIASTGAWRLALLLLFMPPS